MKHHASYLLLLLFLASCTGPENIMDPLEPTPGDTSAPGDAPAADLVVTAITSDGAHLASTLAPVAGESLLARGFCHSPGGTPTVNDAVVTVPLDAPAFEATLAGLQSNTLHAARAYLTTATTTRYGTIELFRTTGDGLATFIAPAYADDYSQEGLTPWSARNRWNLANVHDPTVEKCGDYFYMYTTDASYGNVHAGRGHFPYRRSRDLVNWEFLGMAMPETPPAWIKDSLNNTRARLGLAPITNPSYGYWAPAVKRAGDKYRMYYSIPVDNYIATGKLNTTANFDGSWTERAFIGLRETTDLASNEWEDKGMVVYSATDRGTDWSRPSLSNWSAYFKWNAIDPSFIIDNDGKHWLVYGSWHSGIVALELDPATGKPYSLDNEPDDFGTRVARRTNNNANRWQAQEAPEIIYNPATGYYYLFLAYDELAVAYNTRVCRSRSITGPYEGYNGANITTGATCLPILTHPYRFAGHPGWVGISHCCVFQDPDTGDWYLASQGRLPENAGGNPNSNAIMMGHVRAIRWTDDGWPVVMPERHAGVPRVPVTEAELVGTWEHVTLRYTVGQQAVATTIELTADHLVTGAITGTWSYDPLTATLTAGGHRLYLAREVDWEASPRVPTIVYAGLNAAGESLWGKKIQ